MCSGCAHCAEGMCSSARERGACNIVIPKADEYGSNGCDPDPGRERTTQRGKEQQPHPERCPSSQPDPVIDFAERLLVDVSSHFS